MDNPDAMAALMSIEGFRSLNKDITTIINKSEAVKKAKKSGEPLTPREKRQLDEDEKEFKTKRKQIQEKLIKFATRIPIFMFLTDFREQTLMDVITKLEPGLFKKVTGLEVKDFDLLTSLGLFNAGLMSDAIFKFRRYEDSSLEYTGINKHAGQAVGLFDTVLSREDYELLAARQLATTQEIKADSKTKKVEHTIRVSKPKPEKKPVEPVSAVVASASAASSKDTSAGIAEETTYLPITAFKKGTAVRHVKFGDGNVLSATDKLITVRFPKGEKSFSYPMSVEKGLLQLLN